MKKGIFIFFIFCSISTIAQVNFRGIITEQNSGNKPITLANVKADFANPIQSDSKGLFNLIFQGKNLGDEISINAQKEGFEVVNFKEMMTKIPKKQVAPFKIIMCKAGLVALNQAKYYGISEKYITAKYEKELAKLNRNIASWEEKAAKLEEDFRASIEFAKELAERYSLMNLDDVTELQRKAFKLFEENKVEEAIKILEGENYQENIKKVKLEQKKIQENTQLADEEIAKAEEVIQQQISKLMFQADLYAQDFQFDKAERTYEIAIREDSLNAEIKSIYASYLASQTNFIRAKGFYYKALLLERSQIQRIKILFNLAHAEINLGNYDVAIEFLNNCENLINESSKPIDFKLQLLLQEVYHAKGLLFSKINKYEKANEFYSLCLKFFNANPPSKTEYLYKSLLNNLGVLYSSKNEFKKSLEYFSELYNLSSIDNRHNIFELLNNLSLIYSELKLYDKAIEFGEKCLEKYEQEIIKNPIKYQIKFAALHNNLGVIYKKIDHREKSEYHLFKSLELKETYAFKETNSFKLNLSVSYFSLANHFYSLKNYDKAIDYYEKCIKIREQLASENPSVYNSELINPYINLGNTFSEKNSILNSKEYYSKAKIILQKLTVLNPEVFEKQLAEFNINMAIFNYKIGDYQEAINSCETSKSIYKSLSNRNGDIYFSELNNLLLISSSIETAKKNYIQSNKFLDELSDNIQISNKISNSEKYKTWGDINYRKGLNYGLLNYLDSAKIYSIKAVNSFKELDKTIPNISYLELSKAYTLLGNIYLQEKDYEKAFEITYSSYQLLVDNNIPKTSTEILSKVIQLGTIQYFDFKKERYQDVFNLLVSSIETLEKLEKIPIVEKLLKNAIEVKFLLINKNKE